MDRFEHPRSVGTRKAEPVRTPAQHFCGRQIRLNLESSRARLEHLMVALRRQELGVDSGDQKAADIAVVCGLISFAQRRSTPKRPFAELRYELEGVQSAKHALTVGKLLVDALRKLIVLRFQNLLIDKLGVEIGQQASMVRLPLNGLASNQALLIGSRLVKKRMQFYPVGRHAPRRAFQWRVNSHRRSCLEGAPLSSR